MSWPTKRRFARTLAQAFPAEGACSVEIYPQPLMRRIARAAACIVGCIIIGWLAAQAF